MEDLQALIDRAVADSQEKVRRTQAEVTARIERRMSTFQSDLRFALGYAFHELLAPLITTEFDHNNEVAAAKINLPVPAKDEIFTWVLTKVPDSVYEEERWNLEDPWGNVDVVERNDLRTRLLLDFGNAQAPDDEE